MIITLNVNGISTVNLKGIDENKIKIVATKFDCLNKGKILLKNITIKLNNKSVKLSKISSPGTVSLLNVIKH